MRIAELEALAASLKCELKILGIQGADAFIPEQYAVWLSPEDFLRAVRDATYVVTNSFHCMVFSILFHRPFISMTQNGRTERQNIRQSEILERLELLECRLAPEGLRSNGRAVLEKTHDWKQIDAELQSWREASLNWLKTALHDVGSGSITVRSR